MLSKLFKYVKIEGISNTPEYLEKRYVQYYRYGVFNTDAKVIDTSTDTINSNNTNLI